MGAQPELETHLKYCFQSSKGLVQVRVPLFWFGPLGLGSGFVRERVPVQVRLRTQTPRGGGFGSACVIFTVVFLCVSLPSELGE